MKTLLNALVATTLLALASCSSPIQGTLATGSSPGVTGDAHLTFQFTSTSRSVAPSGVLHTLSEVHHLTVQLTSAGGVVRFASAANNGDDTFTMTFAGLVAGDWKVRALLYDNAVSGQLLFYATKTVALQVGKATAISLAVYQPGSLSGTITEALVPTALTVEAQGVTAPYANLAQPLGEHQKLVLTPLMWNDVDALVFATSQDVLWSSSDESIATVSSKGVVTARQASTTPVVIEARSLVAPTVVGQFYIKTVSALVGEWRSVDKSGAVTLLQIDPTTIYRTTSVNDGDQVAKSDGPFTTFGNSGTWTVEHLQVLNGTKTAWLTSTVSVTLYFALLDDNTLVGLTNGAISQQFERVVPYYPVSLMTLSSPNNMTQGQSATASATVQAVDALGQPVAPTFPDLYWTSSDPSLVSVDQAGHLRAEGIGGSVTLSVWNLANRTTFLLSQCTITVNPLPVVSAASTVPDTVLYSNLGRFTTVQPDARGNGGWYVSGLSSASGDIFPGRQALMARFAADGSHDTGFGNNPFINEVTTLGISQTGVLQVSVQESVSAGFVQLGTSILLSTPIFAGGEANVFYKMGWNGLLDMTYNNNDWTHVALQSSGNLTRGIRSPLTDPSGNVYQLGIGPVTANYPARIRVVGPGLDFLNASLDFWVSDRDYLNFAAVQMGRLSNGQWIVVGTTSYPYMPNIVRLNADGTIGNGSPYFGGSISNNGWTGFGVYHRKDRSTGVAMDAITTMQIDALDRIVLAGSTIIDGVQRGFVARLTANGVVDATFGGHDGIVDQPGVMALPAPFRAPYDLALQPDGKLLVVGDTYPSENYTAQAFVVRVNADGSGLDPTFVNPAGGVLMDSAGGFGAGARSVAIDSGGHIAVAGFTRNPSHPSRADTLPALWRF